MIRLLTGDFGSGKTTALVSAIRADVETGHPSFLLVPEQQTVTSEQEMAALLPPSAPLCFEVTNFSRLANTVFRRVGGLSYHYANAGTRTLVMWRAMGELLPLLHEKDGEQELGRVRKMAAAMNELSALSLTPGALANAAKHLGEGDRLRGKLEDLSLLSTLYHSFLHEKYDDVAEDLDRLGDLLSDHAILGGAHLYVDGFISFTEQEWRVLRAAAAGCDLTVTLTLPEAREDDLSFEETRLTAARLRRMAEACGVPFVRQDMGGTRRTVSPRLAAVLPHLFSAENAETVVGVCRENGGDDLRIVSSPDAFYASQFIACDIARRVKEEGARYRDFAVIARHAEQYAGILDITLQDADIPCFMAKKTDISAYAAIKLVYTAYAVCTNGWRQGDVISYLKCGLSGIAEEDIDRFEMYVTRWKLTGRRFTDDTGWNMNPDGYTDRLTPRGEEIIRSVEGVRRRLCDQLLPFAETCVRQSVQAHCCALYEFFCSLGVEEQLAARAEEARVSQDPAEADILSRLFVTLCDALDHLAETLADVVVDAEQFVDLLRLLLGEVALGRIPTSLDEVTVGSADLLRMREPKHVYLLGVNEGEFPAPVEDNSIFSEGDRRILSALGLSVEPHLVVRAARELFCFARAFATARESVTLLYTDTTLSGSPQQPAAVLTRIRALSGVQEIRTADLPRLSRLWRSTGASDYLGLYQGTAEGEALTRLLSTDPRYADTVSRLSMPLTDADCRLSPETANALYAREVSLTQSRIDRYVQCPFSYFCRYVLKLDAAPVIEFDYSDAGNLLHTVLERYFAALQEQGKPIAALSEDEIAALVDEILETYIRSICPSGMQRTPRLAHLLSTLRRSALLVIFELAGEFSQSDFIPTFFELGLEDDREDAPGAIPFALPGGTRVSLYGRIDRVDTYRRGEKTYLRVIDYKSGDKDFSLADIERGLNTQLLVYLMSLWKSQNPAFRARLLKDGEGEILPAGVLYTAARVKDLSYNSPTEAEKAVADAQRGVTRRGLLLDDRDVLNAMDKGITGRYIPVRVKQDGEYRAGCERSLASLEKMGELVGELDRVICRIAGEIKGGEASARPLADPKRAHACEYCDMKAVCRSSEK